MRPFHHVFITCFSSMHSKDMLSNKKIKKHDARSRVHVVQLQGSSHDIQEWQEKKQYEEQYMYIYMYVYIYMHVYTIYMYHIFTITIIYLKEYYIHHAQKITYFYLDKWTWIAIYSRPREVRSYHILFIIGLANILSLRSLGRRPPQTGQFNLDFK